MKRTVLDVGNCGPDFASMRRMLTTHFDVEVLQTHAAGDTLELLRKEPVDLVLINRKLDCDYSDGTEVLRQIKNDPQLNHIPVMIITNYDEHQTSAETLGAERGFGKLQLSSPDTQARLARFLG